MSSSVDIPDEYTFHIDTENPVEIDMGLDDLRINNIAPITLTSTSMLTSTNALSVSIEKIPKIALDLTFGMKPTRVSIPVNMQFGIRSMGMELLCFHVCGESMVIVEDYVPRPAELCP